MSPGFCSDRPFACGAANSLRVQRLRIRDGYFRDESGAPVYLVGANFWPRRTGPWMYRDPWDAKAIAADLSEVAALGANVVRLFCFLPDFMPASDVVSPQPLERLAATVELAAQAGLWSIPTFLVGHMSGENWSPGWSRGRNWYSDSLLLDASELLIKTVAARFAGDARIAVWLLTNEWPLFAGRTSDQMGLRWARRMCGALHEADPGCNVSLGDGSWDVIGGERSGLPSRELTDVIDFYGPHFYPKETDALRHSAFASFTMRMLQPFGIPVVLEEFGCSSDQADDACAASYYRTVLWSAFGAGSCGSLFWNSHDFTVRDRPPYFHHPYELHFGVIRTDGSRKPQAEEVARFAAFVRKHDAGTWEPEAPSLAIGRTSYYLTEYPFDWGWTRPEMRDLYLQTYASLLRASCTTGFVDLDSDIPKNTRLLIVPCLQAVTTGDADVLERFVRTGGSLYLSHGGEPWYPGLGALIGARPLIRYGLVQATPSPYVQLNFLREFADLKRETSLRFMARGLSRRSAPLACEPQAADVIATDQTGAPALLEHRLGAGRVFFMTHPLEYHALGGTDVNASDETWRLYRAMALTTSQGHAGPELVAAMSPPGAPVQTFCWRYKSAPKRRRILLVNHDWAAHEVTLPNAEEIVDVETGERPTSRALRLDAKGVRIFEVS